MLHLTPLTDQVEWKILNQNLEYQKNQQQQVMIENEGMTRKSNSRIPFCLFCGKQHYSLSCTIVSIPGVRKWILREKGHCCIC